MPSGIIPALAGNTCCGSAGRCSRGDHPRSRGEYQPHRTAPSLISGSSPLSRGIPAMGRSLLFTLRIIPALAGNTTGGLARSVRKQDHPRSRGEYLGVFRLSSPARGSSPLSRGILAYVKHTVVHAGIIPALAGNTGAVRSCTPSPADHPRSRGEYVCLLSVCGVREGSSPLSRGILVGPGSHQPHHGIIPALAGNTSAWDCSTASHWDHPRSRGEYPSQHE